MVGGRTDGKPIQPSQTKPILPDQNNHLAIDVVVWVTRGGAGDNKLPGCGVVLKGTLYCVFLFTDSELYRFGTSFTLYIATPVELALAALLHPGVDGVVAAAAAHQVAAVHPLALHLADPARGACTAHSCHISADWWGLTAPAARYLSHCPVHYATVTV